MKNKLTMGVFAIVVLVFLNTCASSGSTEPQGVMTVYFNEIRQVIDGFGGSNAWTTLPRDQYTARELTKLFYCRTGGMGFTILRNRIPFRERLAGDDNPSFNDGFIVRRADDTYDYTINPDGTKTFNLNWNSWDISGTRGLIRNINALENGPEELVIFSTPWTPPNNRVTRWKEDVVGEGPRYDGRINWSRPDVWGRLRREHFEDYADLLADYVLNFEANMGHPLAILSVQNEPNWRVDYESAFWTGIDLRDFLVIMAERFPKKGIQFNEGLLPINNGLGVMIPEFENLNVDFNRMIRPSIENPEANRILTHLALHQYNAPFDPSERAGAREMPEILATGKRFWQTEVSGSGPHLPPGIGIDNGLFYARMIHFNFTLMQTNAFLFWWLWNNDYGDPLFPGSLVNVIDGERIVPSKRLFAMGQFSRFIRPGWNRIESVTSPRSGVFTSAYRNTNSDEVAIVLINDRGSESVITVDLQGANFRELHSWRTSRTEDLAALGRVRTSGNTLNVSLPPFSITTLYGRVNL